MHERQPHLDIAIGKGRPTSLGTTVMVRRMRKGILRPEKNHLKKENRKAAANHSRRHRICFQAVASPAAW